MKYPCLSRLQTSVVALLCFLGSRELKAAIIYVTTNDNYVKIEAAGPGDEVRLAGGTYAFRVYLTRHATPAHPIVIRASDPANPPTWDFGGSLVENAPGSYTAGDRGRGGWQFSGAHNYQISGIVFRHCRTASFNSAGIRYYNGTTNLLIQNCVFNQNDNGLTGGTQNSQAVVEFCEFDANGNTNASLSAPTHNIYVYGGDLAMRYCYVHDSAQGQNFHIRCRASTLEYNWFARANNYEGDLMTDDDFNGAGPFSQLMILRGNVFVQSTRPGNHSQVVAMYNDAGITNLTLGLRMLYNTLIGADTNAALVHVSNADATSMTAEISDNIICGTRTAVLIEKPSRATVSGLNNWIQTNAAPGPLSNSISSPAPGLRNPGTHDYTLMEGSVCLGAVSSPVFGLPGKEYFQSEATNRQWRIRNSARDVGAFESTTATVPIGPDDPVPRPAISITHSGANVVLNWPLFAQEFQVWNAPVPGSANWAAAPMVCTTNLSGVTATARFDPGGMFFRLRN